MCTVQAPHSAMPQPNLVPVMPSVSRRTHEQRGIRGGIDVAGLAVDHQSNHTRTPSAVGEGWEGQPVSRENDMSLPIHSVTERSDFQG